MECGISKYYVLEHNKDCFLEHNKDCFLEHNMGCYIYVLEHNIKEGSRIMKQVNVWLTDEVHIELVKEAGRRMQTTGKYVTISRLAADIIIESVNSNGSQPTKDAIQDSELDKSPKIADKEAKYTASQLSIDFGKLDV